MLYINGLQVFQEQWHIPEIQEQFDFLGGVL